MGNLMSPSLYLAFSSHAALPAMLVIAKSRETGGTVSCRSALLLPAMRSMPVLREFACLSGTAADVDNAAPFQGRFLHGLAIGQAACDARDALVPVVAADFKRTAWSTLLRWVLFGKVSRGALTAAANHVGHLDGSGQLRRAARTLRHVAG
jgi:hypothetical protein